MRKLIILIAIFALSCGKKQEICGNLYSKSKKMTFLSNEYWFVMEIDTNRFINRKVTEDEYNNYKVGDSACIKVDTYK